MHPRVHKCSERGPDVFPCTSNMIKTVTSVDLRGLKIIVLCINFNATKKYSQVKTQNKTRTDRFNIYQPVNILKQPRNVAMRSKNSFTESTLSVPFYDS